MRKQISSTQNPQVKELIQLKEKSRLRRKTGRFIIEGQREIHLALAGGYELQQLWYCPDTITPFQLDDILHALPDNTELIEISPLVYEKIAHRGSTEGLLAVSHTKPLDLEHLVLKSDTPLIVVAESPEKPGNIGALLRTADAAGIDAVIIADSKTDLYNPNVIRSSVGTLFTQQVATGSSDDVYDFLKAQNVAIYGAALTASRPYDKIDYSGASAVVVGTESSGLTPFWLDRTDSNIIIPMQGKIDSLNVSVSAAIIVFEAIRQRSTAT